MSENEDNVFARWSRRKREVAAEEAAAPPVAAPDEENPPDPRSEEEILEALGLPDPDTLEEGADFSAFMKEGVPSFLRRRALRKLWLTNPALANLDGLVDYGDDFTDAAMVPEVLNTVYQVGKGMIRDILDEPEEDDAEASPEVAEDAVEITLDLPDRPETSDTDRPAESASSATMSTDIAEEVVHAPRRMVFKAD